MDKMVLETKSDVVTSPPGIGLEDTAHKKTKRILKDNEQWQNCHQYKDCRTKISIQKCLHYFPSVHSQIPQLPQTSIVSLLQSPKPPCCNVSLMILQCRSASPQILLCFWSHLQHKAAEGFFAFAAPLQPYPIAVCLGTPLFLPLSFYWLCFCLRHWFSCFWPLPASLDVWV